MQYLSLFGLGFGFFSWYHGVPQKCGTTHQMRKRQQQFEVPCEARTENKMFENLCCPCS